MTEEKQTYGIKRLKYGFRQECYTRTCRRTFTVTIGEDRGKEVEKEWEDIRHRIVANLKELSVCVTILSMAEIVGMSGAEIAHWLNVADIPSPRGNKWHQRSVLRIINDKDVREAIRQEDSTELSHNHFFALSLEFAQDKKD